MANLIEVEKHLEDLIEAKRYDEAIRFVDSKIKETSDRLLQALLLYEKAKALYYMDRRGDALANMIESLSILDDLPDTEEKGEIMFHIGSLYLLMGDFEKAEEVYDRVFQSLSPRSHYYIAALHNLGDIEKRRGKYERALQYFEKCYEMAVDSRNNFMAAYSSENIAEIYAILGNYDLTVYWLETSLPLSRKAGDNRLVPLIELTLDMLKGADVREILERAMEIKNLGVHHAHDVADAFFTYSNLLSPEVAREYIKEAILLYSEVGDGHMEKLAIEKLERMD